MGTTALVSVCLITYNHEKYLAQAIESVLMQVTNFDIEIIIGDDCSVDNTRNIIDQYKISYPDKIITIFREKNIGMKNNFVDILSKCSAKYVAVLSGDDYWTDKYKLQKQFDFLEHNLDYTLIGNNAIYDSPNKPSLDGKVINNAACSYDFDTSWLIVQNGCIASQAFFRNIIQKFPDVYYKSTGEDRRLYILLSLEGKCRFDINVTGAYRIHSTSMTQLRIGYNKQLLALVERIQNADNWNSYLGNRFEKELGIVKSNTSKKICILALRNLRIPTAIKYAKDIDLTTISPGYIRVFFYCLHYVSLKTSEVNKPIH